MVHCLSSCHFQFIKNMIIRTAYKNTGLFHTDLFHKFKVFLACTDPTCDLRKLISSLHTFINGISVFFTVEEKFTLSDLSIRSAQSVKIIIKRYDLICRVRSSGLLSIAEGCICDPDLIRHTVRYNTVIECNLRDLIIVEQIPEHIRFIDIYERIHMLFQLQQIAVFIKVYFSIFHCCHLSFRNKYYSFSIFMYDCIQSYIVCQEEIKIFMRKIEKQYEYLRFSPIIPILLLCL